VILWCVAALLELPYQLCPKLEAAGRPTLFIFADSVTAGMGDESVETWPKLLARSHAINVQDHSQMGAKVRSMLRKTEGLTLGDGIILLEIGGNDLLGSTSARDFERDLDQLLAKLSHRDALSSCSSCRFRHSPTNMEGPSDDWRINTA
jgi:acyl-CoA thioesterase I